MTVMLLSSARTALAAAERLERGELLTFDACPFFLPTDEDHAFLCKQRLVEHEANHIGLEPQQDRADGFVRESSAQAERLRNLLRWCGDQATGWLALWMPQYAAAAELAQVAFHPEEEATRRLRLLDRNDLLHIDASSTVPTNGRRLLRLYVNLHPTDARVWQTSLTFAELLQRYGAAVGWPAPPVGRWWQPLRHGLLRFWQPGHAPAPPYDEFMHNLHDFLKRHDSFQERAPKKCWRFAPGAAWLAFTDGVSHAELRGRFVLEFAFFVAEQGLACPALAPHALFQNACSASRLSTAA